MGSAAVDDPIFYAYAAPQPDGFKEAFRAFADGGWIGLTADPEHGGSGLPHLVGAVLEELLCAANLSFSTYAVGFLARPRSPEAGAARESPPLMLTAMAVIYWLMGYPQAKLVDWIQKKFEVKE